MNNCGAELSEKNHKELLGGSLDENKNYGGKFAVRQFITPEIMEIKVFQRLESGNRNPLMQDG